MPVQTGPAKRLLQLNISAIQRSLYISVPMQSPKDWYPVRRRWTASKFKPGRLFIREIHALIEAGTDFIVEVTLAGKGFVRTISELKRAGYTITIVFIFLKSPETSVARVRNRVQAGGHHVPTEDVVRRFYRSKHNFWYTYRHLVDEWHLFYNSAEHPQEVASGEGDKVTVINNDFFELFMQDIPNGGT
ncbi:MAG: zeta toxin family protein [Candidatus Poribacteria bacterium]|nr:zeta toxin family protein [Candidatus Poribacteria bacterium]